MDFLVYSIIAIVLFVAVYNSYPVAVTLTIFGVICYVIYRSILGSQWLDRWERDSKATADTNRRNAEAAEQTRLAAEAQALRDAEWAAYTPPDIQQFFTDVPCPNYYAVHAAHSTIAAECLHTKAYLQPHFTAAQYQSAYNTLVTTTRRALLKYSNSLPPEYRAPTNTSPFTVPITPTEESLAEANRALAEEFRGHTEYILEPKRAYSYFSKPRAPEKPSKRGWDDDDKYYKEQMREYKEELRTYEQERKEWLKSEDDLFASQTLTQQIFWGTPLYNYASSFIPPSFSIAFHIPDDRRFAGAWIIAPPEKGKTNLLWQLVNKDLDGSKTVILMDSKGDFINPFRNHPDAIVIDYNNAAMNPLQMGGRASIPFLQYLFSSLLEVQMTGLQKTLFSAILDVLLNTPNSTLEDFSAILNNDIYGYEDALTHCSKDTQSFFTGGRQSEFNNSTYKATKDQLKWRLRLILQNEYLRRIFCSTHVSHDFIKLLDSKKLIILDVSKQVLWAEGTEFFGRFFIAMIWMGAVARSEMREQDKIPVHFYVDECHTVMARDGMFRTIIQECRSHKVAVTCAHQYLADLGDVVKPALFNCGIRIANADDDASQLYTRLNAPSPDAIKLPSHQFAVYIRDRTPAAVTINVPFLDLSTIPQAIPRPPIPEPTVEAPPEPPKQKQKPFKKDRRARAVPSDEVEDF